LKKFFLTVLTFILISLNVQAKENINVAFTIDNNYPVYTLLAINSILKNNTSDSHFKFYIVENNVSDLNKFMMKKYVQKRNQEIEFIKVDTDKIDNGKYLFTFSNRITPIAMARILLPVLIPDVDKILYLDSDILVNVDIAPLYFTKLDKDKYAAMTMNIVPNNVVTLYDFKNGYYNSGMILMDAKKWRENNISEKMVNYLQKHLSQFIFEGVRDGKKYLYPDQDLINLILDGKIQEADKKWNFQLLPRIRAYNKKIDGIIHYIGPDKPWGYSDINFYPFKQYYQAWTGSGLEFFKYTTLFQYVFIKKYQELYEIKTKRYNSLFTYTVELFLK
jgi:lipopolysaccharide biosynthesis glycosyltransferase